MCFISKSISKIKLIRRYYHYSHFINEMGGGGQRKFIMSTNPQMKNTAPRFEPQVWLQHPCSYPLPSATLQYVYQVWPTNSNSSTGWIPPPKGTGSNKSSLSSPLMKRMQFMRFTSEMQTRTPECSLPLKMD